MEILKKIANTVDEVMQITCRDKNKKQEFLNARWVYVKLSFELTNCSLTAIGKEVGQKHANILNSKKRIDNPNYFTEDLEQYYESCLNILKVELVEDLEEVKTKSVSNKVLSQKQTISEQAYVIRKLKKEAKQHRITLNRIQSKLTSKRNKIINLQAKIRSLQSKVSDKQQIADLQEIVAIYRGKLNS